MKWTKMSRLKDVITTHHYSPPHTAVESGCRGRCRRSGSIQRGTLNLDSLHLFMYTTDVTPRVRRRDALTSERLEQKSHRGVVGNSSTKESEAIYNTKAPPTDRYVQINRKNPLFERWETKRAATQSDKLWGDSVPSLHLSPDWTARGQRQERQKTKEDDI